MKTRKVLLLILALALMLAGCQKNEVSENKTVSTEKKKIQIGMTFDSFIIERWQKDRDIFVSLAKDMGAEVNVQNANGDVEEQIKQIDYFIEKGMDAIVIICIDSDSLAESVEKAHDAGIKVIAYDRLIHNANVDMYISFDNYEVGKLMGEAIVGGSEPVEKVVMIGGNIADNNVTQVEAGFVDIMTKHNVEIVGQTHCDGWKAELGGDYIYSNLELLDDVDAIMCGNDNIATSVYHALAENRKADNMILVGQDADLEACQRIVNGTQAMTVYKPVEKLASKAAEDTIALIKGEAVEGEEITFINDGTYDVPFVVLKPIAVNEENINEIIINSGFHMKEDVYLYSPDRMPR